jgi:hypothetical protein
MATMHHLLLEDDHKHRRILIDRAEEGRKQRRLETIRLVEERRAKRKEAIVDKALTQMDANADEFDMEDEEDATEEPPRKRQRLSDDTVTSSNDMAPETPNGERTSGGDFLSVLDLELVSDDE